MVERKTSENDPSIYRCFRHAMSIVIHCHSYTHKIPNQKPGLTFRGFKLRRIFELVYREAYFGGLIFGMAYIF